MKKRLIFVLINMNVGGMERAFLNIIQYLSSEEYDITLLLLEEYGGYMDEIPSWLNTSVLEEYKAIKPLANEPPIPQIKKLFFSGRPIFALRLAWTHFWFKNSGDRTAYYSEVLKDIHVKGEFDAAIAFAGPWDFISHIVLEHINANKKVQWIHFDIEKFNCNKKFITKHYSRFDDIVTVSAAAKSALQKYLPTLNSKINVLYTPHLKSIEALAEMPCVMSADNRLKLLTVGRLSKEKGQLMIPDILRKLPHDIVWYLVGDGNVRAELERKTADYALSDRIVFIGRTTNPYPYYKNCDIYVQPSYQEGYCITLAEARQFCKPCVTTDFAGAREQIKNSETGLIVEAKSDAIFTAVIKLAEDAVMRTLFSYNLSIEKEIQPLENNVIEFFERLLDE